MTGETPEVRSVKRRGEEREGEKMRRKRRKTGKKEREEKEKKRRRGRKRRKRRKIMENRGTSLIIMELRIENWMQIDND